MNTQSNQVVFGRQSIVVSTHAAQFEAVAFKGDFEANIAKIAGWGYEGVELAIRDPDLVDADRLEKLLGIYGLKVPAIGTGQAWGEEKLSFTDPDLAIRKAAIGRIKRQIKFAQRFGALVIIGLIRGITPPGQSHAQSMQYLFDGLKECADTASEIGVQFAFEPLNRYETDLVHTVHEGLELIDQIGSTNLGLLLDTFHMNIEETNIEDSIHQAGEQVFHFHVADSNRWHPGAGHLDFSAIMRALKLVGYNGWISGEFMPVPDANTAAERSLSFLKRVLSS